MLLYFMGMHSDRAASVSPSISPQPVLTHTASNHENISRPSSSPCASHADDSQQMQKIEKMYPSKFEVFRKRSKESLSFKKRKRNHHEPISLDHSMLSPYYPHSAGTSPASPKSPISSSVGHQCRCRRCSLLPLEECEPKEVSALFKFLRKSKVIPFYS